MHFLCILTAEKVSLKWSCYVMIPVVYCNVMVTTLMAGCEVVMIHMYSNKLYLNIMKFWSCVLLVLILTFVQLYANYQFNTCPRYVELQLLGYLHPFSSSIL